MVARAISCVVTAALLASCSSGTGSAHRDNPAVTVAGRAITRFDPVHDDRLIVGALFALSGAQSARDAPVFEAVRGELNRLGGAGAFPEPVELALGDTRSDLQHATETAGRLLDQGADVLIVGCDADVALNAARAAARSGRVVVTPCVGDAAFGADRAGPLAFTLGLDSVVEGRVLAERAIGTGQRTAIVVNDLAPSDVVQQCRSFTSRYTELGGRVIAELESPPTADAEMRANQVARLEKSSLIVTCIGPVSFAALVAALRERAIDAPLLASSGADGAAVADAKITYLSPVPLRALPPGVAVLRDADVPLTSAASVLGAVAVELIADAASRAPATDGASLAAALRVPRSDTAIGAVSFDGRQRLTGVAPVFVAGQ